jgi:peroxiredoxin
MSGKWKTVVLAASVFALSAARIFAAGVEVGDKAPAWSGIPGTDDKKHSLADYTSAKAIVLVFTCNHCPVAQAYEERLVALQKDYEPKGVQVVAVNVNTMPADRLDKMKERAEEKGFKFPYLFDESQKMGHDYGAAVTPHAFVVGKEGKLVYIGAIDDNMSAKKVKKHYVRDALDAILADKEPPQPKTKAFGCGIAYEN